MLTDEQKGLVLKMMFTTNYGMIDCQRSLQECEWDISKAKAYLDEWYRTTEFVRLSTSE